MCGKSRKSNPQCLWSSGVVSRRTVSIDVTLLLWERFIRISFISSPQRIRSECIRCSRIHCLPENVGHIHRIRYQSVRSSVDSFEHSASIDLFSRRNVRDATDFTCRYDPKKDPACPILRIGDILSGLDTNKEALFKNVSERIEQTLPLIYEDRLGWSGGDSPTLGLQFRLQSREVFSRIFLQYFTERRR